MNLDLLCRNDILKEIHSMLNSYSLEELYKDCSDICQHDCLEHGEFKCEYKSAIDTLYTLVQDSLLSEKELKEYLSSFIF